MMDNEMNHDRFVVEVYLTKEEIIVYPYPNGNIREEIKNFLEEKGFTTQREETYNKRIEDLKKELKETESDFKKNLAKTAINITEKEYKDKDTLANLEKFYTNLGNLEKDIKDLIDFFLKLSNISVEIYIKENSSGDNALNLKNELINYIKTRTSFIKDKLEVKLVSNNIESIVIS